MIDGTLTLPVPLEATTGGTMPGKRWMTITVDAVTDQHNHVVPPGKARSMCGTIAEPAELWVKAKRPKCPTCLANDK